MIFMTLKMKFGDVVYCHRKALGLSQEALAEKVDISARHVHNIEVGKSNPGLSLVLRLAVCLNIDLNELKQYVECDERGIYWQDLC